jgi:hypothetical protein
MPMMREDFCVFILTHGRPDNVFTYDSLMRAGYTGKVYIIIDDEDKAAAGYREKFGDKVLQFNKTEWAARTDEGDNFNHRKAIVYARNACWELAEQVGCRYFVQFDDDYTRFEIRLPSKGSAGYVDIRRTIDSVISLMLEFYIDSGSVSIAMSQGGDFIGGIANTSSGLRRKCMNSWFCDIQKPINFYGHMNEDVSVYVTHGHRGQLFFTVMPIKLVQKPTQVTPGGMSDLYLSSGTYVKSFYTVMAAPSCTQIGVMGDPRGGRVRIHHKINWHKAVPKIIGQQYQKAR